MALIGLYDADIHRYGALPFNLELMKLATYHKQKKDIVTHMTNLDVGAFSTVIYRKDLYDGRFAKALYQRPNIEYGGLAFTNNKHISLGEDIEKLVPDKYSYMRLKYRYIPQHIKMFDHLLASEHLRLSLDGKTVWKNHRSQLDISPQTRTIMVHDYDVLAIKDSLDVMKELATPLYERDISLQSRFPLRFHRHEDIGDWLRLPWSSYNLNLGRYGLMTDSEFYEICNMILGNPRGRNFGYYPAHGVQDEDTFINKILPQLFFQISYAKGRQVKLRLYLEKPLSDNRMFDNIITLFNAYLNSWHRYIKKEGWFTTQEKRNDSLYRFVKRMVEAGDFSVLTAEDMRDIFQYIRLKNYDLFDSFYQQNAVTERGGILVDERWLRNSSKD